MLKDIKNEELFGDIPLKHGDVIRGNAKPEQHCPTICDSYLSKVKKWTESTNWNHSVGGKAWGFDDLKTYEFLESKLQQASDDFLEKKKVELHSSVEDCIAIHLGEYDGYIGKFPPRNVHLLTLTSYQEKLEVNYDFFHFPVYGAGYAGRIESAYNRFFPRCELAFRRGCRTCLGLIISLLLLLGHSGLLPWIPCIPLLLPAGKPQMIAWGVEMLILMFFGGSIARFIHDEYDNLGRVIKSLAIAVGVLIAGLIALRPGQEGGFAPIVVYIMMGVYALGLIGALFDLIPNWKAHREYKKNKHQLKQDFLFAVDNNSAELERYLRFIKLWADAVNLGKVPKNHGNLGMDLKKYRKAYNKLKK